MHSHAQHHFALFDLPVRYALDLAQLERAYLAIQQTVHPDRQASQDAVAQRLAMQWATQVNDAYQTLKSPLQRAAYLCGLHGVEVQLQSNTGLPPAFLLQQMEWRELLVEAVQEHDVEKLEQLHRQCNETLRALWLELTELLDVQQAYDIAAQRVRQALFIQKFAEELNRAFEQLES